jgi:hypothetical protein
LNEEFFMFRRNFNYIQNVFMIFQMSLRVSMFGTACALLCLTMALAPVAMSAKITVGPVVGKTPAYMGVNLAHFLPNTNGLLTPSL